MAVLVVFSSSGHTARLFLLLQTTIISLPSDALISLRSDLLMLFIQDIWLETKHPRYANRRDDDKPQLDGSLTSVERFLRSNSTGLEEHGNQHIEEFGNGSTVGFTPVRAPFDDDADDEVAEDGLEEEHLGNELGVYADFALEMNMVG